MKPTQLNTDTLNGVITVYDKDEDHLALIIPEEGADKTVTLYLDKFKARSIHMVRLPSAATVTLMSDDPPSKGGWLLKFKTCHRPSQLSRDPVDIDQLANRYEVNNFYPPGLGFLIVEKKGKSTRDTLAQIDVVVSAFKKTAKTEDSVSTAIPEHGEHP
ncbi:hypothetical protein [Pseudomonas putida]|uniref:Uncharacterized protein n=1 Tax=Pseudomonas putida TaxID=303 RepID=A0A6I6XJ82_PSEPU|nr:hypothetical protein [Pseudomonas putida]QHG63925.1 hypothetical protein C2H86_05600 [Pseudomonas putida]